MTTEAEKKEKPICFVIMPISDPHGYDNGHFGRVYEHVLKPAILDAGYTPMRADDTIKTDYIVVGIIQKIVESEMVVCDFSARNPNVMYELGSRHAFNKLVTLIKDKKTDKVFDIQGLRYTEYDESLRIDAVQKGISRISSAIKETASTKSGSINSVIQFAGIKGAEVPAGTIVSPDTQLLLEALASLERRIEPGDFKPKSYEKYFSFEDDSVVLDNDTYAKIGDDIFDANGEIIGELVDIHPSGGRIFIRQKSGKIAPYSSHSIKSKGLGIIPF